MAFSIGNTQYTLLATGNRIKSLFWKNNPQVNKVKARLIVLSQDNLSTIIEFDQQMKELSKQYGEAKDNVKFLTTLERQFKNLD